MRNEHTERTDRFEVILQENGQRVGRIARVYAGDEAEDLAQDILLQIWKSLPGFREGARLSTWVYRIALNTAISWRRAKQFDKRRPPKGRIPVDRLVASSSECREFELLGRFINTLSEIDRAILLMYLDDLTYDEMAETMGVTNGAIRTRISRIRDRLESWETEDESA